jgi:hypothetical protein
VFRLELSCLVAIRFSSRPVQMGLLRYVSTHKCEFQRRVVTTFLNGEARSSESPQLPRRSCLGLHLVTLLIPDFSFMKLLAADRKECISALPKIYHNNTSTIIIRRTNIWTRVQSFKHASGFEIMDNLLPQ